MRYAKSFLVASVASSCFVLASPVLAADAPQTLAARTALPKSALTARPTYPHRLTVKFVDSLRARAAADGSLTSAAARMPQRVATVLQAARAASPHVRFEQHIQLPDSALDNLEQRAAANSGIQSADLRGMMVVRAPDAQLAAVAAALWQLPEVEYVHWQELHPPPPAGGCGDIAPATELYERNQGYGGPDPGINMWAAWAYDGARGQGVPGNPVKVADCEYWFHTDHEDLCEVTPEEGQTPVEAITTNGWHHHGTAVLGELAATENDFGCTGLVPDARILFFPEWTNEQAADENRRVTAITSALNTVGIGDVVLLEMQATGAGGGYAPAEVDNNVWIVVNMGYLAGMVMVEAAGNGDQDLDDIDYEPYMKQGDSGAIIVGSGTPNLEHNKSDSSTYGGRVNVQGWGSQVFTLGYGDFIQVGDDPNQSYTNAFSGTSSASPMVAAAAAAMQGVAHVHLGHKLPPKQLRKVMAHTGVPQGDGGHIGPLPDVKAAVDWIVTVLRGDLNTDGNVDGADLGMLLAQWGTNGIADLDGNGTVDGIDLGILIGNWG